MVVKSFIKLAPELRTRWCSNDGWPESRWAPYQERDHYILGHLVTAKVPLLKYLL
jgi:hypothetical protein